MSTLLQRLFLALFVVVDVVLIVGAVRHVNETPPSSDLPDVVASSEPTAAAPTTPAAPSPSAATSDPAQVAYEFEPARAVALASANDGTVVYGTRGRCADDPTTVQVSTDGGAAFKPSKTGLTTTLAVRTTGKKAITVVGTDADCKVQQITSTDGGATWSDDDAVALWYPSATSGLTVVSPERSSEPGDGCVVTSVSQVTEQSARVSCADGMLKGSGDGGKTWVDLGRLDNVRVASFLTPTSGFALARYNGCAANEFSTSDGGATWTPGGCITGDPAQAISATINGLTAVVADEAYASTDNGASWNQP